MEKTLIIVVILFFSTLTSLSGCVNLPNELNQFSIVSFEVNPSIINQGETANLSWMVIAATSVSIDNGIGSVSLTGHRIIMPTKTTTYILTASNATTNRHVTVEIIVKPSSIITTPTISLVPNAAGGNVTFTTASVSTAGVQWADITYTLVDRTTALQFPSTQFGTPTAWEGSTINVARPIADTVTGGQIITIKATVGTGLIKGNQYQLTLVYVPTGGTLSTATWTQ